MDGLSRDRLAYCEGCGRMRPFVEAPIPLMERSEDTRPGTEYVCAVCYTIIATFETVTPEEFATAAQDIDDPDIGRSA